MSWNPMKATVLTLLMAVGLTGCAVKYQGHSAQLPSHSRVGIVLIRNTSPYVTFEKPYLYQAFWDAGLEPVALNELELGFAVLW